MTTRFVERIAVEDAGEGEPVLLIHGLGGTSNVWTPLLPALARFRTLRPDLPGSGRSWRVEGPLSIARFVEAMRTVCGEAGVDRVHVVAHSLGTIVAFHLAVLEPGLVRSLALFGPVASPPDSARPGIRARGEAVRRDGVAGMQSLADALIDATTAHETRTHKHLAVGLVRELLLRQCPDGYARTCAALADAQAVDVAGIARPTLLVTGDEDTIASAQSVRHLGERITGSRVEILHRCGHWTPVEQAEACGGLLRNFLSAGSRNGAGRSTLTERWRSSSTVSTARRIGGG
jgi:3-oxoadipate enol-lactonase